MTSTQDRPAAEQAFNDAAQRLPVLWELGREWDVLLEKAAQPERYEPADVERELEKLAGDIRMKAHGVAEVIRKLENLAEEQKNDAKRMADKAKVSQAHADHLRQYALACMQALGTQRIETGRWTLSVRENPGRVEVVDAALVPSDYQKTRIEISVDKTAVMAAYKQGELVPGTEIVKSERLAIS